MLRLAFLSSHGGSNMQAIINACKTGTLRAKPCVLVSNNSTSTAIERAREEGIPFFHLSQVTHSDPDDLDQVITDVLRNYEVDVVILAGYMKKLGPKTLKEFRIINIHPSLLPKFGGKDMYGKYVHEAVIAAGEKVTGITIHLVDEEYDTGKIINQCEVPVLENDTLESLSERVLMKEHQFIVETLIGITEGKFTLD
jgi:phosphoribosylglycinamide formyltransferase-1